MGLNYDSFKCLERRDKDPEVTADGSGEDDDIITKKPSGSDSTGQCMF